MQGYLIHITLRRKELNTRIPHLIPLHARPPAIGAKEAASEDAESGPESSTFSAFVYNLTWFFLNVQIDIQNVLGCPLARSRAKSLPIWKLKFWLEHANLLKMVMKSWGDREWLRFLTYTQTRTTTGKSTPEYLHIYKTRLVVIFLRYKKCARGLGPK